MNWINVFELISILHTMCWMLDERIFIKVTVFFYIYLTHFQLFPNFVIAPLLSDVHVILKTMLAIIL